MGLTFGKKYADAPQPREGGGSTSWIRSLKEGETRVRFLQEVNDWTVYYEHYNPTGTAFPCTGDRSTCPGCTSGNERMKQASRKNAVNALVDGYVNVYKFPQRLTNRIVARSERNGGTITDRDYLITRIGKDTNTEYEIEQAGPVTGAVQPGQHQLNDIEGMLAEQFKENFPDFDLEAPQAPPQASQPGQGSPARPAVEAYVSSSSAAPTGPGAEQNPWVEGEGEAPFEMAAGEAAVPQEEVEVTEEQLRSMDKWALLDLCHNEHIALPTMLAEMGSADEIVDYLLENV